MEALNIVALLLIALSNVYIGIQVRAQKTTTSVSLPELRPTIEVALEPAPVTVLAQPSALQLDYNKLGASIKTALLESQIAVHNARTLTSVDLPSIPGTTLPTSVTAPLRSNDVEISGFPARQFPIR